MERLKPVQPEAVLRGKTNKVDMYHDSDVTKVAVKDIPLTCKHCGGDSFVETRGQLTTPLKNFLGIDWSEPCADVYVCTRCGFLHWFLGRDLIEQAVSDAMELDTDCLSCGATVPAASDVCPRCGWSYRQGSG